jgi:SAM-dependent methyltransferase
MDPAPPDWMLDEVANAGRENLDADHARRYDSKMDSSVSSELDVLRSLGLHPGSTMVEFGAGTGQLTVEAAQSGARVIAVDVSAPMLDVVRAKVESRLLSNVEIVQAGFLTYGAAPESVDLVYSRLALHHLPDAWKALALQRIHDMLRPGGCFRLWDVVYDFEPSEMATLVEAWCATGVDVPPLTPLDDGWGRWEIAEHVRDEHSTFRWILEPMIERVGLVIEQRDIPDPFTARYVLRRPS